MSSPEDDREQQLRQQLLDAAPKPSQAHDRAIREAAQKLTLREAASPRPRWPYAGAALAAALALAVILLPLQERDAAITRSADAPEVFASPAANDVIALPLAAFTWDPVAGATRYRVTVYDDAAVVVATSAWLSDTTLPADFAVDVLQPDRRYFWTVDFGGDTVGDTLGPFWFRTE